MKDFIRVDFNNFLYAFCLYTYSFIGVDVIGFLQALMHHDELNELLSMNVVFHQC